MSTTKSIARTESKHASANRVHNDPAPQACEAIEPGLASSPLSISVVVPVRNEDRFIERTLEQLLAQAYDPARFDVHVVDGESTDHTRDVVRRFARRHPNVHLHGNPKRLSSAGRNVGVRHATGDVVLIVDGHCDIPDRFMLARLAEAFRESGADCIGRPQPLEVEDATPLQQAIAAARSCWLGHHPSSLVYSMAPGYVPAASVAVAYRREVFDRVGYFDEHFDACEDYEMNVSCDRAGLQCYFAPKVAVRYFPRKTLVGLFRQLYRYGRGRVRLGRKMPHTWSLGTLVPPAFLMGATTGWATCMYSPLLATFYFSVLALYMLLVLGTSVRLAARHRRPGLLWRLPAVFATIHVASGCGGPDRVFRPQAWPAHRPLPLRLPAGTHPPKTKIDRRWEIGDGRSEMGDGRWERGERRGESGERRSEMGDRRWEMGDGRSEIGDGRWEMGDGRWEIGDGRWEMGDGRWKMEEVADFKSQISNLKSQISNLRFQISNLKSEIPSALGLATLHAHLTPVNYQLATSN